MGALHGLPISLKDQIRIKGLETTMGMPKFYHERLYTLIDLGHKAMFLGLATTQSAMQL